MSWKHSGRLVSGPPVASGSSSEAGPSRLSDRVKPNPRGQNTFHRERQLAARYGNGEVEKESRRSEWDVLKENHRFIRDDEEPKDVTWEERLARAYESKLFKEFALVDLKHYKSKRFALRWRTAPEVVEGVGEDTCGSLRCKYHEPTAQARHSEWSDQDEDQSDHRGSAMPRLRAFELPFAYQEQGQRKEALVKVKLCPKCEGKLKWKPPEAREERRSRKGIEEDDGGPEERSHRHAERSRSPRRRSDKQVRYQ